MKKNKQAMLIIGTQDHKLQLAAEHVIVCLFVI